jgi:DNA replication protein DnaC
MLREPTLSRLRELRLRGMADGYLAQEESAEAATLSFEERLGLLVDAEWTHRRNHMLARLVREAHLRIPACPEDVDFERPRGLDRATLRELFAGGYLSHHQNVLLFGATGVGKTYLACALGQVCCRLGLRAFYARLSPLLSDLAVARMDILDDFGLAPLTATEARDLFAVVDDRYEHRSTVVASQLPLAEWHRIIADPTLADAILDRLVHNAHTFTLIGESMRKKKGGGSLLENLKRATLED